MYEPQEERPMLRLSGRVKHLRTPSTLKTACTPTIEHFQKAIDAFTKAGLVPLRRGHKTLIPQQEEDNSAQ